MFRNYLKASLRFLANNKGFSLLNIIGLSIGTLCCIYILVDVREQYMYDRSWAGAGSIYRITSRVKAGDTAVRLQATTPPALAAVLGDGFPDQLESTQICPTQANGEQLLWYQNRVVYEKEAYEVDRNFFQVFNYRFIAGTADDAFAKPGGLVLTKALAEKLFGNVNPIGRAVEIQNRSGDFGGTVCGVVERPGNTAIPANLFFTHGVQTFGSLFLNDPNWFQHNFAYTFVRLASGASVDRLEKKLTAALAQRMGGSPGNGQPIELQFQPVSAMHTTGGYESEMSKTVSGFFLGLLIALAALIQLIACINFMNLATARASRRAKEVGVRKIIGAANKGLILQFLVESCILSVTAVVIALPLLILVLPWINQATGVTIPRAVFAEPAVWTLLFGVAIITGLLAGSYPAFYLSDFQAAKVIKGDYTSHISVAGLRRGLVVFQFVLSIVLIVGMIVIRQQLDFIRSKDLGFTRDSQFVISFHAQVSMKYANYFATAIRQFPGVKAATLTDNYPGAEAYRTVLVHRNGVDPGSALPVKSLSSDEYFLRTMGIPLVSGRDFHFQDTGMVIINQTMARGLGLDVATAEGRSLFGADGERYTIAGVMKDFNYESLHEGVAPLMVAYTSGATAFDHLIVNAPSAKYSSLFQSMEAVWKKRVFVEDFDAQFLSDKIQLLYQPEIIMGRIVSSFTVMAMVVSCLGLFGLAAFNAEQRTKEIGIRKVMGASVSGIVQLLSVDFLRLIIISFGLGVPVAWLVMNSWLAVFAYHIRIPWWTFGIAGAATVLVGMAVVGWQSIRAAVVNPVESLRAV